jgi:hypothetical protein
MTSRQVRRTQLQSPNNRPFTLHYSIPNSTTSRQHGVHTYYNIGYQTIRSHKMAAYRRKCPSTDCATSHNMAALHYVAKKATWRSAGKADAAPISEQNIHSTLKTHLTLPNSTTSGNMAYTHTNISNTNLHRLTWWRYTHDSSMSNTRLHHVTQYGGCAWRHDKQHGDMRLRRTKLHSSN